MEDRELPSWGTERNKISRSEKILKETANKKYSHNRGPKRRRETEGLKVCLKK